MAMNYAEGCRFPVETIPSEVRDVAQAIKAGGGRALIVGGFVRDHYLAQMEDTSWIAPSKDIDLEVFYLGPKTLKHILSSFGTVKEVGKAFGVLHLVLPCGTRLDVSLPRKDSQVGSSHKDVEVEIDPFMEIHEAAKRRDFTMNAMAADPLTGQVYDFFNGIEDMEDHTIQVTDQVRFQDDALRALRGIQFAARFQLGLSTDAKLAIRKMAPKMKHLSFSRLLDEWRKLLVLSPRPSIGLDLGLELGIFDAIHPELPPLKATPQDELWHPEGDVWVHTMMVVDQAAEIVRREGLIGDEALTIMLGALCHDLGKPKVTKFEDGRIRARAHEPEGEAPTRSFLNTMGVDKTIIEKVVAMVTNHLVPSVQYGTSLKSCVSDGVIRRLAKRIHPATIKELVLVAEADHLGRGPFTDPEAFKQMIMPPNEYPAGAWLLQRAAAVDVTDRRPENLVSGRDWLALGVPQGRLVGAFVEAANELRDDRGLTKEQVLALVQEHAGQPDVMKAVLISALAAK